MDLSKYSREERLQLLEIIEEMKRRLKSRQALYQPNAGQLPVHQSRAGTRAVFSGNGAGKTALAAHEAMWAALGWNPVLKEFTAVPARIVVVIDHPSKSDDLWIPEMEKWFDFTKVTKQKRGMHHTTALVLQNGSEILFFSHAMDPLIFESIELDVLICDEPPPRHVYIGLSRGGRKKNRKFRVLIVGTPLSQKWMRLELWEPWSKGQLKDVECFKFGTRVNEQNLREGYVDDFGAKLTEKEKRMRFEGEFHDLEGLALAHLFSRDTHVIDAAAFEWPDSANCVVAIDPHPVKGHFAVMVGVDRDGQLYVLREIHKKVVARVFARELLDMMRGFRVADIVCDCLGSQESTAGEGFKSFIEVLREEGVDVRATTWEDKQDEDFLERIRDDLYVPDVPDAFGQRLSRLRFLSCCLGSISDCENAQWMSNGRKGAAAGEEYRPKLDIGNKDFLSCLKYALASGSLTPSGGRAKMYTLARKVEPRQGGGGLQAPHTTRRRTPIRLKPHRSANKALAGEKWKDW